MLRQRTPADSVLVVLNDRLPGRIDDRTQWRSAAVWLLSFSQSPACEEVLVLMPPFSWVRGALGTFYLDAGVLFDRTARLVQVPGA
jgi:hypothetical protein